MIELLVGLHLCGDFSSSILREISSESISSPAPFVDIQPIKYLAAVIVPCCYNLITEQDECGKYSKKKIPPK